MHTSEIMPFVPLVLGEDGKPASKIQVLPVGEWEAPFLPDSVKNEQGKLEITAADLDEIIGNFNKEVRKGLPIDIEHDQGEAAGWMTSLERVGTFLVATVEWTKLGLEKIKSKQFKFFSPEFSPRYIDPQSGEEMGWVLIGGGLVNRPLFKELAPVTAKENLTGDGVDMILLAKTQSMSTNLQEVLEKDKGELTDEERQLIRDNEGELSDDQKSEYKDVLEADGGEGAGDDEGSEGEEDEDGTVENPEDGDEDEGAVEKGDAGVQAKEKMVSIKASDLKELKANADQGVKAFEELRENKAEKQAQEYIVGSENGRVLEAGKDAIKQLILSMDEKQAKLFAEVMKNIPDAHMFSEIGADESSSVGTATQKFEAAIQKIMAADSIPYKKALLKAQKQHADLYKAHQDELNSK